MRVHSIDRYMPTPRLYWGWMQNPVVYSTLYIPSLCVQTYVVPPIIHIIYNALIFLFIFCLIRGCVDVRGFKVISIISMTYVYNGKLIIFCMFSMCVEIMREISSLNILCWIIINCNPGWDEFVCSVCIRDSCLCMLNTKYAFTTWIASEAMSSQMRLSCGSYQFLALNLASHF